MFYTDGFLNESTYFSRGYIWHLVMKWNGKECLFLCISDVRPDKEPESVENVLRRWLEQELSQVIEKGAADIQREVNRFHVWFQKWCGMGEVVKSPVLCLYFQGHIYFGKVEEAVWSRLEGHRGMILSCEITSDSEGCLNKWGIESLNTSKSVEEIANTLKADMMATMSKGVLKSGYFVLWEEMDDF